MVARFLSRASREMVHWRDDLSRLEEDVEMVPWWDTGDETDAEGAGNATVTTGVNDVGTGISAGDVTAVSDVGTVGTGTSAGDVTAVLSPFPRTKCW